LRSAAQPPLPLLDDYCDLCPNFVLADAKEAARDFCIPELVQVTFYVMVVNEALELGVLSGGTVVLLKSALTGLWQSSFES